MIARALPERYGDWLQREAIPVGESNWLRRNRSWIRKAELGHPGSAETLRTTALDGLAAGEADHARRSIAVLAVVGTADDVPALRRLMARETELEQDGRAAIDEIENRVAAGREPLQVLKSASLGNRIARWLFGFVGVASVLLGVAGFVVALSHHRSLGLVPVVRVLGVIGFGFWCLWIARTGTMPYTGRDL